MARALAIDAAGTPLAFAITDVRAVIPDPSLTPVPTAPPVVLGLTNVRGEVVPVFDTGLIVGGQPIGHAAFVVVVDTSVGVAGFAVSAMPRTTDADDETVDPVTLVPR